MRREIVLIVLLLAVLGALLYLSRSIKGTSEADAKKFFLENLAQNYPNADVREITDVVSVDENTIRLKARVSSGLKTACPERMHIYYNYPAKNFIYEVDTITSGCVVCRDVPKCILLWPEEAIIASHKYSGAERVAEYIKTYSDATPTAEFMPTYADSVNVWKVVWDSPSSPSSITAYLSQAGNSVIDIQVTPKGS